jgi:cytochrome c oxidase subunit 4
MSENEQGGGNRHLWRRNGLIWFALLALLLASCGTAYIPLGSWNAPIGIAIAFVKGGLVATFFMELNRSRPPIRLAGAAGLFFVFVLFGLTIIDVWMRLNDR